MHTLAHAALLENTTTCPHPCRRRERGALRSHTTTSTRPMARHTMRCDATRAHTRGAIGGAMGVLRSPPAGRGPNSSCSSSSNETAARRVDVDRLRPPARGTGVTGGHGRKGRGCAVCGRAASPWHAVGRLVGGPDGQVVEERQPPPGNQRINETAAVCETQPSIIGHH